MISKWNEKFNYTSRLAASSAMILISPFLAYMAQQSYQYSTESLLILAGVCTIAAVIAFFLSLLPRFVAIATIVVYLAIVFEYFSSASMKVCAIAAIVLAMLLRQNLLLITVVAFSAFNLSTLFVRQDSERQKIVMTESNVEPSNSLGGPLIHIILDAQTSVSSAPGIHGSESMNQFADSLMSHGFKVYGNAYSEYGDTRNAIANLMNFATSEAANNFTVDVTATDLSDAARLVSNKYFDKLKKDGRELFIYQTDYLDMCSSPGLVPRLCSTTRLNSFLDLVDAGISFRERLQYVWGSFQNSSYRIKWARANYDAFRNSSSVASQYLPAWIGNWYLTTPVSAMRLLETFSDNLSQVSKSDAIVLHLMLPHSPYAFYENCEIRPDVSNWQYDRNFNLGGAYKNTLESRQSAYGKYFDQVDCLRKKLDILLSRVSSQPWADDATIIIHGDHGSRILEQIPFYETLNHISSENMRDRYSALLAIRRPGSIGEYSGAPIRIRSALSEVAGYPMPGVGTDKVMVFSTEKDEFVAVNADFLSSEHAL